MISELVISNSKHPLFQCSNILRAGVRMLRRQGRRVGTHFKNEPENHLYDHHPTDCTQDQLDSAMPGIVGPIVFQSPSVHERHIETPRNSHG